MPEWIWKFLLGVGALAIGLIGLGWIVGWLKRRFQHPPTALMGSGWTLEQVKRLHESGQLTDKQHKRLREEVANGLKKEGYPKRPGR